MGLTYKESGVDVAAGNQLIHRIKGAVQDTHHEFMLDGIGGFAGLAAIPSKYSDPVLVFGTDGVGSKIELAREYDRHETVGQDLVAMCVNDLVVPGGEPFVFLDYYATGKLSVASAERVIQGIARACKQANCALGGGETAEMPGFYANGQYDLAGFAIGLVERAEIRQPHHIKEHDILIGLSSVGPHSNGYSLIRKILEQAPTPPPSVLEEILSPTTIYVAPVISNKPLIKGVVHITGGGLRDNLPRAYADDLIAQIDPTSWSTPESFDWIQQQGAIDPLEMFATFNCGIGMVLICRPNDANQLLTNLQTEGVVAQQIGTMVSGTTKSRAGWLSIGHQCYGMG